jgi:hypothetical protein
LQEKIDWMEKKIEEFSSIALLERTPKIRIVESIPSEAKTSFWHKDILVCPNLILRWEKGDIDKSYIETVLAHEMGHVIDLYRGIHSTYLQLNIITVLGFILPILSWIFILQSLWARFFVILVEVAFFLGAYRNRQRASEFGADRNALQLILEKREYTKTYHTLMQEQQATLAGCYGRMPKITTRVYLCFFPSFQERLRNLGFEEN